MVIHMHPSLDVISEPQQIESCVYHLSSVLLDKKGTLTCHVQALVDGEVIGKGAVEIISWDKLSMMYSAFASKVFGLTSENSQKKTVIPTENSINFIGSMVWNAIHDNPEINKIWDQWKSAVENNVSSNTFILVSGEHFNVTMPVECIRYASEVGDFIQNYNIPILRSFDDFRSKVFPTEPLPTDIIVFFGNEGGEALSIKGELRGWLTLLQPNREWTEEDLNSILARGESIKSTEGLYSCKVTVVPKGDIDYLKSVLDDQIEPFNFIYVGHGTYHKNTNHEDGNLLLNPVEYACNSSKGVMSHEKLTSLLRTTSVRAVFLNCCEGIRNFQVIAPNKKTNNVGMEQIYFNDIRELNLLSAFRSKVSDLNMGRLSVQLVDSILHKHTILQYNARITQNDIFGQTGVTAEKSVRDHVSRLAVIRTS